MGLEEEDFEVDSDFAESINEINGDRYVARDEAETQLLSLLSFLGYDKTVESYEKLRSKYVNT